MCGIFCIISADKTADISRDLINGLKLLEYRGYDSAGVALLQHCKSDQISNDVQTVQMNSLKAIGQITNLEEAYNEMPVSGYVGIAHTRWATHGAVTINNTHPIIVQDIAVVHNGVVENYFEIRQELHEKYGYVVKTQTDTEVISALIYYFLLETHDLLEAVRETVIKLTGKLSFAVMSNLYPESIICVSAGRQLIIGKAEGQNFIASDVIALPKNVRSTICLDAGDIAVVSGNELKVYDSSNEVKIMNEEKYIYQECKLSYDSHQTFMHKEIDEQHEIIDNIISKIGFDLKNGGVTSEILTELKKVNLKACERIHIIACGAAFYAGYVGKYLIERDCRIVTSIDIASEFSMRNPVIDNKTLYIFVSQSGETADTISAMEYVRNHGVKTLAIVNRMQSPIAKHCDIAIPICAGIEQSVAATKTFTTQILVFILLTMHTKGKLEEFCEGFDSSSLKINSELEEQVSTAIHEIVDANRIIYVGRDVLYPICLEGALKIKEIGYIAAEGIPAGEIKHGPIALVDEKTPVVILAPYSDQEIFSKTIANIQEIKARKGNIILITCRRGNEVLKNLGDIKNVILVPESQEEILPITYAIPLQLLAYHYALKMGYNIDKPRNLAKSVTVE